MALTIDDLKPKSFKIHIKGVELTCKPARFSDALALAKIGNAFQEPDKLTSQDMKNLEAELDDIVVGLVPDLKDIPLDIDSMIEFIEQVMSHTSPAENKELADKGVNLNADPKA